MRRLLVVLALVGAGLVSVPAAAERPAPPVVAAPPLTGGAIALGPSSGPRWLGEQYAALAGAGELTRDLLRRYGDTVRAEPAAQEYDFWWAYDVGDIDGDRFPDLLVYRTRFVVSNVMIDGDVDLSLLSGRTGTRRWHKRFANMAGSALLVTPVGGKARPGLVFVKPYLVSSTETAYRFYGLDARRATKVYDKTVRSGDGRGAIQWGGIFDAYPGGGTELLIGRVRQIVATPVEGQSLLEVAPFVLDGSDGAIRQAHRTLTEVSAGVSFAAVGDLNGDKRDDIVRFRSELRDMGTVTAYGVVEDQVLWERSDLPVGRFSWAASANVTGTKAEDLLVSTWTRARGLLDIPGVTDGTPLLDGPDADSYGILFDGPTGTVRWTRMDNATTYEVFVDVDRDGKVEVVVTSVLIGLRDGFRHAVVNGANKVLATQQVTVAAPLARDTLVAGTYRAGDLDGDRVEDLAYLVRSASRVRANSASGFLLTRPNRLVPTADVPFGGTLDGGTAERMRIVRDDGRATFVVSDGWRGDRYWTFSARDDKDVWADVWPLTRARGRCADVLVYGGSKSGTNFWVDVVHGGTGDVRWSRTLIGRRPAGARAAVSGRAPACR